MQRIGYFLGSQVFLLLVLGSHAWSSQSGGDDYDNGRKFMYTYGISPYKRLPSYDFGLGKRNNDDQSSYEDGSGSTVSEYYNLLEKRAPGNNMYSFGLGKRNRAYGFGLGKRLEQAWKASTASVVPAYRQERRSKIYSFGLGKRGSTSSSDLPSSDYYEEQQQAMDKRTRQFSFGLGKREVGSISATNNTT